MKWMYVLIGGGMGSVLRFALGVWLLPVIRLFPWATLVANVFAAAIIGVLYSIRRGEQPSGFWYFAAVGFCGGLSTFSSFSLETAQLIKAGHYLYASLNVGLSIVMCIALVWWLAFYFKS